MLKLRYIVEDYVHLKNNVPTYSGTLIKALLSMRIYPTFAVVQNIINSTVTPQQTQNDVYRKMCVILKLGSNILRYYSKIVVNNA
jgi:hypothetical protein